MAPRRIVTANSERRDESAVVESRRGVVERGRNFCSDARKGKVVLGAFTGGRQARRTTASGRRLEVALPLCDQRPTSRSILNCRRLVPTFDPSEAIQEVAVPPIEGNKVAGNLTRSRDFSCARGEDHVSDGHRS